MTGSSVLIIDDDRSIVRLCQRLLERAGYGVSASTDPLEALKILEAQKMDLLLADIRMPVMDGFELIERARGIQPDIAVLVMTGFGTVDTAVQALYKGVDGLILKPFENTTDVVQAVERVLVDSRQKQDAARLQALRPLFDISEQLVSETSQVRLEALILENIATIFNARHIGVFETVGKGNEARLKLERNLPALNSGMAWGQLVHYALNRSYGEVVWASRETPDGVQGRLAELGWSSLLIMPIQRDSTLFTFLAARDENQPVFSGSDNELFTILARQSVVAMENARLYTDLKEYVKKVEDSQRALVQAEKMAAVGRLVASMAHEINNPLQAVRNCVHLAMRRDIEDAQRITYLTMTENEVSRLVETVRQMLDFYRPGPVEKEAVKLPQMIERVSSLIRPQLNTNGVSLAINIPEDNPAVFAVKDQIQQVVFNLLLNSMDAVENAPVKKIWVDLSYTNANGRLTVEDSGPGVPSNVRERLFEPFTTSKKSGTGLGLSISYSIIESHGGRLGLIPGTRGQGACFEMTIPLAREA